MIVVYVDLCQTKLVMESMMIVMVHVVLVGLVILMDLCKHLSGVWEISEQFLDIDPERAGHGPAC